MKKSITATVLSAMMALSLTSTVFAKSTFSDVPATHWANATVEKAVSAKLINGYEDGTFKPENTMSKIEFLSMLDDELSLFATVYFHENFDLNPYMQPESFAHEAFHKGLVSRWGYDVLIDVYSTYIIDESYAGTNWNESITRAEIAKIITRLENERRVAWRAAVCYREPPVSYKKPWIGRAAGTADENLSMLYTVEHGSLDGYELQPYFAELIKRADNETLNADTSEIAKRIADWNSIPKEYQPYVANIYSKGFVNGYEDGTFKANNTVTRAEAVAILLNFVDYLENEPIDYIHRPTNVRVVEEPDGWAYHGHYDEDSEEYLKLWRELLEKQLKEKK